MLFGGSSWERELAGISLRAKFHEMRTNWSGVVTNCVSDNLGEGLSSLSSFPPSLLVIARLVLEEFDFCTCPYSNTSVNRAGTPNPSSK